MEGEFDILLIGRDRGEGGGISHYIREQHNQLSKSANVSIFDTTVKRPTNISYFGLIWAFAASFVKFLRFAIHPRVDIVHIHTSSGLSFYRYSLYVLYASKIRNMVVVLHTQGSHFDKFASSGSWLREQIVGLVFRNSDRIVALTEAQRTEIANYVPEQKIRIFKQPVNMDGYDPDFKGNVNNVIFLASFQERKGIIEFVEAIEELLSEADNENLQITIVGDGPLVDHVTNLEELHPNVEFLGYVAGEKKVALWNKADIYVLPTFGEGFPIAIVEAMAGGNAIITTNVSGIPEVIGPDNGLTIEPGNVPQLVDAIQTLLNDPDQVREMGKTNHERAVEEHAWPVIADGLMEMYRQGLTERNRNNGGTKP